ncbi:mannose-6-phosphate isomerase, class I [Vibrio splendidus]|uniref:mannose-6-phosphate isomerase, class I n=1 Tax=Vibrio splendidus TaxID=29497 RepID=UPI000C81AF2E|nr:mannose-6-phosphate isomerase, class I [Vibrio splendidus]PMI70691.1 mannose-6-phosphate isomerase, class I [Vibrio splendidus]PMK14031.1 mannose-6-phosphate isomerase, class I [Vibrio splendidus]PMK60451.1 mannose-6-phosphate isomerase, class I [Vibrio splendidus]
MFKLKNQIKNYAWGSRTSISELFGIDNPNSEPQAEIWMGAHLGGCSTIGDNGHPLFDAISQNMNEYLGEYTTDRYGQLPFLFKVLAADTPLSIQVHPSKRKSEVGFSRENLQGIDLDDPTRNYKDSNHKPELVYALTPYRAMNGFRPIENIISLFDEIALSELYNELNQLKQQTSNEGLACFFNSIMTLNDERRSRVLSQLEDASQRPVALDMTREAIRYSQEFKRYYGSDIGLLSPFILNIIELDPGEAMFLFAETPHAYVEGTALEIMASSDNVLRAGLTPKHMDIPELLDNVLFTPTDPKSLVMSPIIKEGKKQYPIPVDDFGFDILYATDIKKEQYVRSAEILFCIDNHVVIISGNNSIELSSGEALFVPYSAGKYSYSGKGRVARSYN